MATWTNEGLADRDGAAFQGHLLPSYVLALFTNDLVIGPATVFADLVECLLPLYARVALLQASWVAGVSGGVWTASYPTVTFHFGPNMGGVTIYGACVLNVAGGVQHTAFGERWAVPFPVPAPGGSLTVDPSVVEQAR